ncbi:MAG: type II toxin-antitoxin system RelE/ParE family toxin [Faecalibacterium longum]|nr:type II toxin-antitoxin system RelE/ParE family toxin [Faecalibacterium longum]
MLPRHLPRQNSRRLTPTRSGQTTKAYGRRWASSMTYKIKYLPLAVQDLNEIARYLSGFYPKTASRVLKELREKITKLGDTPKMCEVYCPDPAYRRMVVDQYLVFYRVNDEIKTVEVHRVLRGTWNLPQYLE